MLLTDKYDIFYDPANSAYQIRSKTGVVVVEFSDKEKEGIFTAVIQLYKERQSYSFSEITRTLSSTYSLDKVMDVIGELEECGVLSEDFLLIDREQLQGANYAGYAQPRNATLGNKTLGYIGAKVLGEEIRSKAKNYGYRRVVFYQPVESFSLGKVQDVFSRSDFVIVDAARWNPELLDNINMVALDMNRPWLLVDGMFDSRYFSVGPIFWGRSTGCYECYKRRLRSNDEFANYTNSYEDFLRDHHSFSKPDSIPNLVAKYMSCFIVIDISKYIGGWYIPETWRANVVFDISRFSVVRHVFLKTPICHICNPMLDYNPSPWLEAVTLRKTERR